MRVSLVTHSASLGLSFPAPKVQRGAMWHTRGAGQALTSFVFLLLPPQDLCEVWPCFLHPPPFSPQPLAAAPSPDPESPALPARQPAVAIRGEAWMRSLTLLLRDYVTVGMSVTLSDSTFSSGKRGDRDAPLWFGCVGADVGEPLCPDADL